MLFFKKVRPKTFKRIKNSAYNSRIIQYCIDAFFIQNNGIATIQTFIESNISKNNIKTVYIYKNVVKNKNFQINNKFLIL